MIQERVERIERIAHRIVFFRGSNVQFNRAKTRSRTNCARGYKFSRVRRARFVDRGSRGIRMSDIDRSRE